jgi:hypothetical protein
VVRASENATHFGFYHLPGDEADLGQIEPEAQIPAAGVSLPFESHQITLPQPGVQVDSISVLLCVARSTKSSELMVYRVSLDRHNAHLSLLGGTILPEQFDVIDCVLGERGVRGVASIAAPRRDSRATLFLLTCTDTVRLCTLQHPVLDSHRPTRLAFDEVRGTVVFLDDEGDIHVVLFDTDFHSELELE